MNRNMARLGAAFIKNVNFFTNGNLYLNRIQCEFSPSISTIKTEIVKKIVDLDLPKKPKKPLNPYLLFVKDTMEKVKQEEPLWSTTQVFTKCGQMWKDLNADQRAKYHEIFKGQQEKFHSDMLHYEGNLTEDQRHALDSVKQAKKIARQERREKKELKTLGKPKQPLNAYALFLRELSKVSNKPFQFQGCSQQWKDMSDTEKQTYVDKAKKLRQEYEEKLALWEDKMRIEGREDLVRKTVLNRVNRRTRILKLGLPEEPKV